MIKSRSFFIRLVAVSIFISLIFLSTAIEDAFAIESQANSAKELATDISDQIGDKAEAEFKFKKEILSNFIQQIEDKVRALANSQFTINYAAQNSIENQKNLAQLFYIVASGNESLMQVRFLDAQGWEKVRVDRPQSQGLPITIKEDALQNKGSRGYFLSIKNTPAGQLWHSRFDLNMEGGEIETPLNPTFRVGTPVFYNNSLKGIVIINLRLEPVLKLLRNSTDFDVFLFDQDGKTIIHPDRNREWSRYFPQRGHIFDTFPILEPQILKHETHKNSLFSYALKQNLKNDETLNLIFEPKQEGKEIVSGIAEQWLKIRPEIRLGIVSVFLFTVVILGTVFYWNRKLVREIKEKKQVEKSLLESERKIRESEDRVKTVLNSINTGIIIINPQNRTIVDVNPAAANMIGLSKEDIIGETCHQFICPKKYKECPIIDLEMKVDNTEGVLVTANGEQIPILKTVVPVLLGGEKHLLESFVDLTGRKVAEEDLKEKMEELERFNELTINREERMIELKEEINQLSLKLGNSLKYKIIE